MMVFLVVFFPFLSLAQNATPVYKDKSATIEERVEDLLKHMTLEEKLMQTTQWTYGKNANENNINDKLRAVSPEIGSLIYRSISPVYRNDIMRKAMEESRLGIPILMGFDVIHGYRTIFPIPLAQACSWNTELVKKSCEIAAKESWLTGIDWTFSPMIDVARDPRWGRVSEGYGEDTYANSVFCVVAVEGYQGTNLSDQYTIAACLKHYIGYSLSEGGRDYQFTDVSAQTLWETFMPPYEAGVKAGAATLMSAFNDISGVPASANRYTLTEVLKERWQHDGFVVSDWGSVVQLIDQGVAKDSTEAALKAFMAGVEMDMVDDVYFNYLPKLIEEGKVPMKALDEAVRRILRVKFRLGLFDQPYIPELEETDRYLQPDDLKVAEELAAESMVLLKNENNILPISADLKNIALIGPMVKDRLNIMGSWEGMGREEETETIFEGLQKEFGASTELHYALGCDFEGSDTTGYENARKVAKKSDLVILCLGEKKKWSGENGIRSTIALPAVQEDLVNELKKTGKPMVVVLSNGRPLELVRINSNADAIVEMWQPGSRGGSALAGILSGRTNPSGKLAITFPYSTGQIPMHYNRRQSSRPFMGHYQDIPKEPMYCFGHGLSYTTYNYGDIKLSDSKISKNDKLVAEIEVTNAGEMDGKETVHWFISDPVANISRPMKELKFFEKKEIKAGEKYGFKFEINPEQDLSYPDSNGEKHLETGDFYLLVGDQKVKFELVE